MQVSQTANGSHLQESDQADDCFLTMKARLDLQRFNSSKKIENDLQAGQVSQTAKRKPSARK
jgi:hypothetical protein